MTGKSIEGSSEHFIPAELRLAAPVDGSRGSEDARASLADRLSDALAPLHVEHPDIELPLGSGTAVFESAFQPASDVISATVDAETVLLNLRTGYYYSLNRVGSALWDSLNGTRRLRDIVDTLCKRYAVPEAEVSADVFALIQQLLSQGLIVAA